jgi:small subunit ribosomal protein S25e
MIFYVQFSRTDVTATRVCFIVSVVLDEKCGRYPWWEFSYFSPFSYSLLWNQPILKLALVDSWRIFVLYYPFICSIHLSNREIVFIVNLFKLVFLDTEMEQRKAEGEGEQYGSVWSSYLWQTLVWSSQVQAHHPINSFWSFESKHSALVHFLFLQTVILFMVNRFRALIYCQMEFYLILSMIVLQINGSLARRAIRELMSKGTIRLVAAHANQQIYTRATNT